MADVSEETATAFDCKRLAATLLAFAALLLLVLDVLTIYHVVNSILALGVAGLFLLGALCINLSRWCALAEAAPKRKAVWSLLLNNGICLVNAIALDAFLYTEVTYNYFGHTEKEQAFNRRVGSLLELFVVGLISWSIFSDYRKELKQKETRDKKRSSISGKTRSMV